MNILGVGPLEIILIIVLMLVILGPKEMVITARKIGRSIRDLVKSPYWAEILSTSREIREIPNKLVQDIGIEDEVKELQRLTEEQMAEINKIGQETSAEVKAVIDNAQVGLNAAQQYSPTINTGLPSLPSGLESTSVIEIVNPIPVDTDGPVEPITDIFLAAGITPPPTPQELAVIAESDGEGQAEMLPVEDIEPSTTPADETKPDKEQYDSETESSEDSAPVETQNVSDASPAEVTLEHTPEEEA
jgi:Sec-independent protein translocase protein TatA